jgi:hypothetical protein
MNQPPGERVTVTSPRTRARRRSAAGSARTDIDEQTTLGEVYLRSLLRAQLRLSLFFFGGLLAVAGAIPLVFLLDPSLSDTKALGIPLPWLLLGVVAYPLLCGCGWLYVRAAERTEREFAEMVDDR